jgi:hypothetical protein
VNGSKITGDSAPVQSKGMKTIYINSIRIIGKYSTAKMYGKYIK